MKRSIRLKEFPPNTDTVKIADQYYLSRTDGSLSVPPGASEGRFTVKTNPSGYQVSNLGKNSTNQMVLLGDSFVENMFVTEDKRFQIGFESALNERNHSDIEVLNGGYSGMTTLQQLNVVINKVLAEAKNIRYVLLFACMCDSFPLYHDRGYWTRNPLYSPLNDDSLGSKEFWLDKLRSDDLRRILSLSIEACKKYDILPIAVGTPFRTASNAGGGWGSDPLLNKVFRDEQQWQLQLEIYESIDDAWLETGSENKIPTIDSRGFGVGAQGLFYDTLHLNDVGSVLYGEWLANAVSEVLSNRNLI